MAQVEYDLSILIPARKLFLVSEKVTSSTPASFTVTSQFKNMTSLTVSFTGCLSCDTLSSQYVSFLGNKLKVVRITAASVATQVVNLVKASTRNTFGYRFYKVSVHQSVDTFGFTFIPKQPIALVVFTASPFPALTELNFLSKTLKQLRRYFFNFKHSRSIA